MYTVEHFLLALVCEAGFASTLVRMDRGLTDTLLDLNAFLAEMEGEPINGQ